MFMFMGRGWDISDFAELLDFLRWRGCGCGCLGDVVVVGFGGRPEWAGGTWLGIRMERRWLVDAGNDLE